MKYNMIQRKNLKSDYYHFFNSENIQYYDSIKKYMTMTKNVKGEILEFGIGRGRSSIAICHIINELNMKKKFIGFDSFLGFGEIGKNDKSYLNVKSGEWSNSPNNQFKYEKNTIKKIVYDHIFKKNFKKIEYIEGFIENTLLKKIKKINSISFINLDLDLYEGHKAVLNLTYDKLSKNGIIYFDDIVPSLKKDPFPGAKKAFNEFFKNKKIRRYICPFRKNMVIQKP